MFVRNDCQDRTYSVGEVIRYKIVNVAADEAVLDDKGKVDPAKLNALMVEVYSICV